MNPIELEKIMKRLDLTDEHLAEILGVTANAVRYWRFGDRKMTTPIVRIIKLLNKKPSLIEEFGYE